MNTMKITTKIYIGFALAVLVCFLLGIYGIWNFSEIRRESQILTSEYVPEVDVLSKLERDAFRTIHSVNLYTMTGQEKLHKEGLEDLDATNQRLKETEELLSQAPHLKQLASNIEGIRASVKKYKVDIDSTKEIHASMMQSRQTMQVASLEALKNILEYHESQNEAAMKDAANGVTKEEIGMRLKKIFQVSSIVSHFNEIRVSAWKDQAEKNFDDLPVVRQHFSEIERIVKDIRSVTTRDINIRQLDAIDSACAKFKEAMDALARDVQKLNELDRRITDSGEELQDLIERTSKAGIDGARTVADNTSRIVNSSVSLFALGLFIAIAVAAAVAFMIATGIGRALRQAIDKLRDSSQQVTDSASQLSSAAQQLSSASNEQASSIEETSSSLEQIAGMIENNVSNAEQSYKLSSEVMQISETANASMQKLELSMREILSSNEKIEQLVKVIGNIGEKTKIMDEIVFQTKLLSFNASVEAERAGEHGRGFAVVAQEVGNLAQMSGKSAQEIADIVKSSIHEAELITNENKKKVEQGNQFVGESAKGLKMIMEAARTVASGSNQVLQASKDQATGIKQVSSAMTQLDNATQQNAATAEETAASSEELNAQAEVLNSIVIDLSSLVEGQGPGAPVPAQQLQRSRPRLPNKSNVVPLTPRPSGPRLAVNPQKKVAGSDIDPSQPYEESNDAWEKL